MSERDDPRFALARRHIIAALDVDDAASAVALARELRGVVSHVKIGSKLFVTCGPALLDELAALDMRLFLDLKWHDIPSVVAAAVRAAAAHEAVFMVTAHALGGATMIREAAAARGLTGPEVIAVTALTSMQPHELRALGITTSLPALVEQLAELAISAGAQGLVCSPHEARALRARFGPDVTLVTPGIRSADALSDDQSRVMTAARALAQGSDWLVIGRPIYAADAPRAAAEAIALSLQEGCVVP